MSTFDFANDPDTAPLWRAHSAGTTLVRFQDHETRYNTLAELWQAMQRIARAKTLASGNPRPKAGVAGFSRGHH